MYSLLFVDNIFHTYLYLNMYMYSFLSNFKLCVTNTPITRAFYTLKTQYDLYKLNRFQVET